MFSGAQAPLEHITLSVVTMWTNFQNNKFHHSFRKHYWNERKSYICSFLFSAASSNTFVALVGVLAAAWCILDWMKSCYTVWGHGNVVACHVVQQCSHWCVYLFICNIGAPKHRGRGIIRLWTHTVFVSWIHSLVLHMGFVNNKKKAQNITK